MKKKITIQTTENTARVSLSKNMVEARRYLGFGEMLHDFTLRLKQSTAENKADIIGAVKAAGACLALVTFIYASIFLWMLIFADMEGNLPRTSYRRSITVQTFRTAVETGDTSALAKYINN